MAAFFRCSRGLLAYISLSLVVVVGACSGGNDGGLATELEAALPDTLLDFSDVMQFGTFEQWEPTTGELTNEDMTKVFFWSQPTAAEISDRGRITGYQRAFSDAEAWETQSGVAFIVSEFHVFTDTESAAEFLDLWTDDTRSVSRVDVGIVIREFEPNLSERSVGLEVVVVDEGGWTSTSVHFQTGRLLGMVDITDLTPGVDHTVDAEALATRLLERLDSLTRDTTLQSP